MCSGGALDSHDELRYVRERYVHRDGLRAAIAKVCTAFMVMLAHAYSNPINTLQESSIESGSRDFNQE